MGNHGGLGMGPWRIASASAAGTSHIALGIPCQDAYQTSVERLGTAEVLLLACADGAGSAPRSDEGARWACDEAILALKDLIAHRGPDAIDGNAMLDVVVRARERVIRNAADSGAPPRDFASTLLVIAVTPREAVAAQVGDGAVVIGECGNLRLAISVEQELLNVTDFLVDSDARTKVRRWSAPAAGIDSIAVSTDGLMPVLIDHRKNQPHPPMFGMLFGALRETADETEVGERLSSFLRSEQVCQRTDDDKTLVLAFRKDTR
jgi:hypothetical protein